jgi:hypothetical protein
MISNNPSEHGHAFLVLALQMAETPFLFNASQYARSRRTSPVLYDYGSHSTFGNPNYCLYNSLLWKAFNSVKEIPIIK